MASAVNVNGTWKSIKGFYANVNGTWKSIIKGFVNVNGIWKQFFSAGPTISSTVTISASTPAYPNYTVVLTGENYTWTTNTGETYRFEHSSNSGATWSTLTSGTATDYGSYTYTLANNGTDVSPNVTNLYRFSVTATNSSGSTTSTSGNATVYGAENVTLSESSHTYNSVTIQWTASPHANRYMVEYKKSSDSTWITSGNGAGGYSSSPATITTLTGLTSYDFRVKPWTGSSNNNGYAGNYSNTLSVTTSTPPSPVQLTIPTLSGSGQAFTTVTPSPGTYQTGTYTSIANYVGDNLPSSAAPVDGSTTGLGSPGLGAHTISQYDATTPAYRYYSVDEVTYLNGTKYYYFSNPIQSYIGTVTDNYNRTVSTGSSLGTMSSGYIYSSYEQSAAWSVNGSYASNTTNPAVGAASSASYPLQTIEVGRTDLNMSVQAPGSAGGIGLAFWVTSGGSWYAVAPYYNSGSYTYYLCNGTSGNTSSCTVTSTWPTTGGTCSCGSAFTTTTYNCDGTTTAGLSSCTAASNWQTNGGICSCSTQTSTVNHYYCNGPSGYLSSPCTTQSDTSPYVYCYCAQTQTTTTTYAFASGGFGNYPSNISSVCNSTKLGYAQTSSISYFGGGFYTYNICSSSTSNLGYAYTYTSTSISSTSTTTTYTSTNTNTTNSSTSYPYQNTGSANTGTNYYTNLRIYAASGSSVSVLVDDNKDTSTSSVATVWGTRVSTSGNTITAGIYSDPSLSTIIGTSTVYTASNPTKTESNGKTSAGIIKTGSSLYQGQYWDNLTIY